MANEILVSARLRLINGRNQVDRRPASIQLDQTGDTFHGPIQYDLGAAYESAAKGDIGNLGWAFIENPGADGGENVVVSLDAGVTDCLSIPPGGFNLITLVAGYTIASLQFKAASSAARVAITLVEA